MYTRHDDKSGPWKKDGKKDHGSRKDGPLFNFNPGQFRFSIWYFVGAVVLLLAINAFLSVPRDSLIEYSAFKERILQGEIKRVEIDTQFLLGTTVAASEAGGTAG